MNNKYIFICILIGLLCFFKGCETIQCYTCNSASNETCATGVGNELESVECDRYDTKCAMTIIDGDTYRGCSNLLPHGPKYYTTCDISLCNGQVYPPGRIKCYQCSGPTCVPASEGKPKACKHHLELDSCYTDIISDLDGMRGCVSNKETLSPNAVKCNLNGCNNQEGFTDLVCTSCDTNVDRGCTRNLFDLAKLSCNIELDKNCTVRNLFGRPTETCFVFHNIDRIVRGCTSNNNELNTTSDEFIECNGNFCNRYCIDEVKCLQCNSTENELCRTDPGQLTSKLCVSSEDISCYSCEYSNEIIGRGCGVPDNIETCSLCSGSDGCNNQTLTKCYNCNSEDNSDCVHWLQPENITQSVCLKSGDECGIVTKADGNTERGCKSSLDNLCVEASNCNFCEGNLCNDKVYSKPDALWCYYCNLNNSDDCANITSNQHLPCVKYAEDNRCFQFLNDNDKMVRGCSSDILYNECLEHRNNCIECDSDGCNNTPLNRNATFSCHVCSEIEPNCAFQLDNNSETLKKCKSLVKFDERESCYIFKINETLVVRGCTADDKENLLINRANLEICETSECNKYSVYQQKCIQCIGKNTIQDDNCTYNVSENLSSECSLKNITYELRGCFVKKSGDTISRGCVADLSSADLQECNTNDTETCLICDGLDCNTKNLTGGAVLQKLSSFIILFVIFQYIFII